MKWDYAQSSSFTQDNPTFNFNFHHHHHHYCQEDNATVDIYSFSSFQRGIFFFKSIMRKVDIKWREENKYLQNCFMETTIKIITKIIVRTWMRFTVFHYNNFTQFYPQLFAYFIFLLEKNILKKRGKIKERFLLHIKINHLLWPSYENFITFNVSRRLSN